MENKKAMSVASKETIAAMVQESDSKYATKKEVADQIASAELGGMVLEEITAEEVHALFTGSSTGSETA